MNPSDIKTMAWKLWLDDDINNKDAPERWVPEGFIGAETSEQAIELVRVNGLPEFMDLDHDLGTDANGQERTAKTFLKWLVETYPDGPVPGWRIHSRNPEGKKWIESFLDSWRRSL